MSKRSLAQKAKSLNTNSNNTSGNSKHNDKSSTAQQSHASMRIDKWLWAARFFKTRSVAKEAIEGGKVHHDNIRVKVSKEVRVGMQLTIKQGMDKKTVEILGLSNQRGPAPIAQQLYQETAVSIARRELLSTQRKLHNLARPEHRPTKKDRRLINKFKQQNDHSFDHEWNPSAD
ncbi:heat shock protein Hsp15 [Acinetobacter calcoaceticus]|uniref:Heat shock protein Hsp15 n=1 Tax=Acinetobacter calcoaceticus TaxID=471 RepID=A0A4R1XYM0_ACICA|nr:heat shock protein Hsp15 [Acinetobacter calcoaceticus]